MNQCKCGRTRASWRTLSNKKGAHRLLPGEIIQWRLVLQRLLSVYQRRPGMSSQRSRCGHVYWDVDAIMPCVSCQVNPYTKPQENGLDMRTCPYIIASAKLSLVAVGTFRSTSVFSWCAAASALPCS